MNQVLSHGFFLLALTKSRLASSRQGRKASTRRRSSKHQQYTPRRSKWDVDVRSPSLHAPAYTLLRVRVLEYVHVYGIPGSRVPCTARGSRSTIFGSRRLRMLGSSFFFVCSKFLLLFARGLPAACFLAGSAADRSKSSSPPFFFCLAHPLIVPPNHSNPLRDGVHQRCQQTPQQQQ